MKLQFKTIVALVITQLIFLVIIIASALSLLTQSSQQQITSSADTVTRLVANSLKHAQRSQDFHPLKRLLKQLTQDPDLVYIRISSNKALLIEAGSDEILNSPILADLSPNNGNDGIFDMRVEIAQDGDSQSLIEMGLSTQAKQAQLSQARYWFMAIAFIATLLLISFCTVVINSFKQSLRRLKTVSEVIAKSSPGHQIAVHGNDEIGNLIQAFNTMSSTLAVSYQKLSQSSKTEQSMVTKAMSNEAKNNAILNASLDALVTIDEEGKVVDYNNVAAMTFGWSVDEIIGQNLAEFIIPPNKRNAHHQGIKHYLLTKKSPVINQRIQLTAHHKLGHAFPIEINISPIVTDNGTMFTAFIRDITSKLQAETELRLAAKTFESSEAIFICDASANIIRTNHAFTRITGFSFDEVKGKNPRILASGWHDKEYYHRMWTTLLENGEWKGEIYNQRRDGETFPNYLNISSVKNDAGSITHYIAHFMDISSQKQTEKHLRRAQLDAEASNQSKSRFLASMSHEIRTPLNAILGILGLLKDSSLNEQQRHLVQTGRGSGELLLSIINDVLDFSKLDVDKLQLEKTAFDLHKLFATSVELLEHLAVHKSLALSLDLDAGLPQFAKGDPDRIRQILINLINNAIKFTPHGSIKVSATTEKRAETSIEKIAETSTEPQLILRCKIQDTGVGISAGNQADLFQEFTMVDQTHTRKHEGTGLGLAICKRLVSLMGGNIHFNSQLGRGSTFEFSIPLEIAHKQDISNTNIHLSDDEINALCLANTRILLAEDNPANQMVIKSILTLANMQVDIVANGFEAIEAVRNIPYDLVLMDISMPEMDGMEATQKIRQLRTKVKDIPIVALTAHSLTGDKERFLQAGMNAYLSKPIDRMETLACIARLTQTFDPVHNDVVSSDVTPCPAQTVDIDLDADYVDEASLQKLVRDTSSEVVPKLITFYIQDSVLRMKLIEDALKRQDLKTIEFETHSISSTAAAHGNRKLYKMTRNIEQLCKTDKADQAIELTAELISVAEKSFNLLAQRAELGFTSRDKGELNE